MKKLPFLLLLAGSLLFTSCATYHLSTESLVQQFADTKPEKKYIYTPTFPAIPFSVKGNDLQTIKCLDKNNKETIITVTNRTSVRITRTDSSHTIFYFNTLLIQDSTISGSKTHFFEAHIRPIKLREVAKIEIQKS
jgi:uncharacterized protein (UPF0333 family)